MLELVSNMYGIGLGKVLANAVGANDITLINMAIFVRSLCNLGLSGHC
jgi:hypothetical protein